MNDGLDIPEVDGSKRLALVFDGKSLSYCVQTFMEQWYELSGMVLQDLFPRVNVARLQRKLAL